MPNSLIASPLEQSIYATIRYFDIHDMPVTATHIWRCLMHTSDPPVEATLGQVRRALHTSSFLREHVADQWGFYFMRSRLGTELVTQRLQRHCNAQAKWKLARRAVWWLQYAPYVRLLAGSGSLALFNTKPSSDLDIFVITAPRRIWTTRLCVLIICQLLGRRRTYRDRQAPDKACVNHYITEASLLMPESIRNVYTAILYTHLVPEFGLPVYMRFMAANSRWLARQVTRPALPVLAPARPLRASQMGMHLKHGLEGWLNEPVGELVERAAERVQRYFIGRHTIAGRAGRVVLSSTELAFHPDSKADAIVTQFTAGAM